jgi:iron complex transport system substrate-binding protein
MIRQHPHTFEDVLTDIEELADACGCDAGPLMAQLRRRIDQATRKAAMKPRVRGVFLEWLDPPYRAGHWTPDLLEMAGIDDPLARPGVPSVALTWGDVKAAQPQLLILAPCGFDLSRAKQEAKVVQFDVEAVEAQNVVVLDGSAYFNRPGPRLVDSLELLVESR